MRVARKYKTLLAFSSCLFLMVVSLVCSGVGFADTAVNSGDMYTTLVVCRMGG